MSVWGITTLLTVAACGGARSPGAVAANDVPSEVAELGDGEVENTTFAPDLNVVLLAMEKLPQGIYYRDMVAGEGVPAMPGREALISYIAYLPDGTEVDRTALGARPLSRYAYGRQAVGKIPPNSVMVFFMRLDGVR